jgi:uncharacterized protein YbjT (DUF2867 family)
VLVTGATGLLGGTLLPKLAAAGYAVRGASRRAPRSAAATGPSSPAGALTWTHLDLAAGDGLDAAVRGVDVIVHCAASTPQEGRRLDVEGTRRLLKSARAAGVRHFVYISIVGVERVPFEYYRCKVAAEHLIEQSGIPYTILRAAQFYELIDLLLRGAASLPVMLLPTDFRTQPVDVNLVAERLFRCVQEGPQGHVPDLVGPEVLTLGQAAKAWRAAHGVRKPLVHLPLPGKAAAGFRSGGITSPAHATPGPTWADWLRAHAHEPNPYLVHRGLDARRVFATDVTALSGALFAVSGLALLFAPSWFYEHIGHFPPFNRHYAGDLGTLTLALGLGLLWAARNPARHRALIATAALGSLLHTLNHLYDDVWLGGASLSHVLADAGPLALGALLLAIAALPRRTKLH